MLSLHPFNGARISLVTTNLLGDIKGECWTDSADAAMGEAARLAQWPDTVVWVYDVVPVGEAMGITLIDRAPTPNARVGKTDSSPFEAVYTSLL